MHQHNILLYTLYREQLLYQKVKALFLFYCVIA